MASAGGLGAAGAAWLLVAAASASAQMAGAPSAGYKRTPGVTSAALPPPLREIGFDQNLGQSIPLDMAFRDESGRTIALGDYFGKRPIVMVFRTTTVRCSARWSSTASRARSMCFHSCRVEISRSSQSASIRTTHRLRLRPRRRPISRYTNSLAQQPPGTSLPATRHPSIGSLERPASATCGTKRRNSSRTQRVSSCSHQKAGSLGTSSVSSTAPEICATPSLKHRTARLARRSTRCCSIAFTMTP